MDWKAILYARTFSSKCILCMSGKGKNHRRSNTGFSEVASPETKAEGSTCSEDACEQNEENEITLKEIRQLFLSVQQTLQVENTNMADEMEELKTCLIYSILKPYKEQKK